MRNIKVQNWSYYHTIICICFVLVIPCIAYFYEDIMVNILKNNLVKSWFFVIAGFILVILTIGHGVTGTWKGAFVDNRNVMSLSRIQILGWTILVLSAFSTIALWNMFVTNHACLYANDSGCLPDIPEDLWLSMGISTTSMVASPLILGNSLPDIFISNLETNS